MYSAACRQERFAANANVDLRFEVDSVLFDTVFATVGTITKRFKVYNPTSKNISIDEIFLGGRRMSGSSNFRLNINGLSRNEVQGMQLAAGIACIFSSKLRLTRTIHSPPIWYTIQSCSVPEIK